jgi:hypothetical protein
MYISIAQSISLDKVVKSFEVAFRSFIAETLINRYATPSELATALTNIAFPSQTIYAKKFQSKIKAILRDVTSIHKIAQDCSASITTHTFDNDVPYVSELIDILLIFFNDVYSHANIAKEFNTVEEFHYCSGLYHSVRNNLSHPASRPIAESDAAKVIYFIYNLWNEIDDKYFWYISKTDLILQINSYQKLSTNGALKAENLSTVNYTFKQLLCREAEITKLYLALIGDGEKLRLAGSVVLYGYGGVGKTAITTEFILRLLRDKKDGKHPEIEFILFYSSKDEFLKSSSSTGELYIDAANPQFETLDELKKLIMLNLDIDDIGAIANYKRGIIVIDNIENIRDSEKAAIIDFIKSVPRSVQFLVTSRSEELCEEKIHIEEFNDSVLGTQFIENLIDSEGYDLVLSPIMIRKILDVSKGNALIIVQVLNNLSRELVSFEEITMSLETLKSKNAEIIANFMYKNTFDNALFELKSKGYPATRLIQLISLYDEKIELYSISRLAEVEISVAEALCNFLLERLVLVKAGEYYELNEFARKFVFIKLLPDKIELGQMKDAIRKHKIRMRDKLLLLEQTLVQKNSLRRIVSEWQPRNYIDKIIIAELVTLYLEADNYARKKNLREFRRCCDEFKDHTFITNHPYVAFQKARLLKLEIRDFSPKNEEILQQIESSFEEAIESIEFDYRYLMHTPAHSSLLMMYGVFLALDRKEHGRAIRYLEDSKKGGDKNVSKTWFICSNYLALCYKRKYEESKITAYKDQLRQLYKEVTGKSALATANSFDIQRFIREYRSYI